MSRKDYLVLALSVALFWMGMASGAYLARDSCQRDIEAAAAAIVCKSEQISAQIHGLNRPDEEN